MTILFKRFLAFSIDVILLYFIGVALSLKFEPLFHSMGRYGFCIGLLIFFGYFTAFEIFTAGRSPGKLALGLKVYNRQGKDVKLNLIIQRLVLMLLPYTVFNYLWQWDIPTALNYKINFIGASSLVLFFFQILFPFFHNGLTVHDAITKTCVASYTHFLYPPLYLRLNKHLFVFTSALILTALLAYLPKRYNETAGCEDYPLDEIRLAFSGGDRPYKAMFYCAKSQRNPHKGSALMGSFNYKQASDVDKNVVEVILKNRVFKKLHLKNDDELTIIASYEYDIGIYSYSVNQFKTFTAADFEGFKSRF